MTSPYRGLIERLEATERRPWGPPEEGDYNDVPVHAIGPEAARAIRDLEADRERLTAALSGIWDVSERMNPDQTFNAPGRLSRCAQYARQALSGGKGTEI